MASNPELMRVEDSVKQKYLEIVTSMSNSELRKFKKTDYKKLLLNEMTQLLPDFDEAQLKETAHS